MRDYHVNLRPREYQQEALEWALERDSAVCCLPTGTGKTLVAALWCCKLLNLNLARRILIIEPSRFLVEQNYAYFRKNTNLVGERVYGVISPEARKDLWKKELITVCTAQTALNDLKHIDHDAIVVDECHHTTGQHAFKQLLENYPYFKRKLGLSATIPKRIEMEVSKWLGEIRRWHWSDPKIKPYLPSWYGEVYDTEFNDEETELQKKLEEARFMWGKSGLQGLISFALRTYSRDGALALQESAAKPTILGSILHDLGIPFYLEKCRKLHKSPILKIVLTTHEFQKAIIFVDRVVVARALAEYFEEYNPVVLLGRLHSSTEAQKEALQRARNETHRLIISTSVGEEGIDLPEADLLIIWSNTVSTLRFIQRHGRLMRRRPKGEGPPKVVVYLATPDTEDYDALRDGVAAVYSEEDMEMYGIDLKALLAKSVVGRVQKLLSIQPTRYTEVSEAVNLDTKRVEKAMNELVRQGEAFYVYNYPPLHGGAVYEGILKYFVIDETERKARAEKIRKRWGGTVFRKEDRYYVTMGAAGSILKELPQLFDAPSEIMFEVRWRYHPKEKDEWNWAYGTSKELFEKLKSHLDERILYLTCTTDFQVSYHGQFTEDALFAVLQNYAHLVYEEKKERNI
jgi:ERCC4-related helicase